MNRITHGKIDLEQATQVLTRKGMSGIANLLQCLYDNERHAMNHQVEFIEVDGKEYIRWREDVRVDGVAKHNNEYDVCSRIEHDEYYGIRA